MAAFLAIPGSTWPEVVARMVFKVFLYFLQSRFALSAERRVTNLYYYGYEYFWSLLSVDMIKFDMDILRFIRLLYLMLLRRIKELKQSQRLKNLQMIWIIFVKNIHFNNAIINCYKFVGPFV